MNVLGWSNSINFSSMKLCTCNIFNLDLPVSLRYSISIVVLWCFTSYVQCAYADTDDYSHKNSNTTTTTAHNTSIEQQYQHNRIKKKKNWTLYWIHIIHIMYSCSDKHIQYYIDTLHRYSGNFHDGLSSTNHSISGSYVDYARDYYTPSMQNASNCLIQNIQRGETPTYVWCAALKNSYLSFHSPTTPPRFHLFPNRTNTKSTKYPPSSPFNANTMMMSPLRTDDIQWEWEWVGLLHGYVRQLTVLT